MRKSKIIRLAVWFFTLVAISFAQNDEVKKCKTDIKGGNYKVVFSGKSLKSPNTLSLFIVVKPKNITSEYLYKLAKRLKSEYCYEEKLIVSIFDNKKYANIDSLKVKKGDKNYLRGSYSFDNSSKKEYLSFSSKLGNPADEIKLVLP